MPLAQPTTNSWRRSSRLSHSSSNSSKEYGSVSQRSDSLDAGSTLWTNCSLKMAERSQAEHVSLRERSQPEHDS